MRSIRFRFSCKLSAFITSTWRMSASWPFRTRSWLCGWNSFRRRWLCLWTNENHKLKGDCFFNYIKYSYMKSMRKCRKTPRKCKTTREKCTQVEASTCHDRKICPNQDRWTCPNSCTCLWPHRTQSQLWSQTDTSIRPKCPWLLEIWPMLESWSWCKWWERW